MAHPKSERPTELELQILKILWDRAPLPVREVRRALAAAGREIAHTSVITTLNTMTEKKYLKRRMEGNACLFEPRLGRAEVSRKMLGDLVDRLFDGSAAAVMLSLFEHADMDAAELKELRASINRRIKGQS